MPLCIGIPLLGLCFTLYWTQFDCSDSVSSTKPVRGSTQCGVDRGRDRPAGIKVDVG